MCKESFHFPGAVELDRVAVARVDSAAAALF